MGFPGLTNYREDVPGTDVVCFLGRFGNKPDEWRYSLWTKEAPGYGLTYIVAGDVTIPQPDTYVITPNQVARIAFLLEVEYA